MLSVIHVKNCKRRIIQNYDNIRVKNDILDVCLSRLATVSSSTVPGSGGSLAATGVTVLRQLQRRRKVLEGK